MKWRVASSGNKALNSSKAAKAVRKHTFTLLSFSLNFMHNSKPLMIDILTSRRAISNRPDSKLAKAYMGP